MADEDSTDSIPEDILNIFYAGESPLCSMENLSERREVAGVRRKMLMVSNQRLLYFEENATGLYDATTYAFARIDSVVFHRGRKTAEFRIIDTDGAVLKLPWLANDEAEQILRTLQTAMNDLGTATVSLDRKQSVFSGEEWTLKKPVDYLTKTVRTDNPPMTKSYVAPILPKSEEDIPPPSPEETVEVPLFDDECADSMSQETIVDCLRALRLLYENKIIPEENYRKLRLPLLEKLDI